MFATTTLHPTLSSHLLPGNSALRTGGLALGFSLFIALMAQVAIPLPFTPVPLTGQTLAVLLVGIVLGPRLGLATVVLYLLQGVAGLPVFAGGKAGAAVLAGPTGGYLLAFPLAAALMGALAQRGWDRNALTMALGMVAGLAVIFALGLVWLGVWLGMAGKFGGVDALLGMGLWPFLPGEALKAALVMALLPTAWKLTGRKG